MTAKVVAKYDARIAERLIPAGRWAEGEDVAACVAALASGQFAYATGTGINADGKAASEPAETKCGKRLMKPIVLSRPS